MRVVIERSRCVGHARCNKVAEQLYPLDETGYIATDGFRVAGPDADLARRGARACPERIISVEENAFAEATFTDATVEETAPEGAVPEDTAAEQYAAEKGCR
jgi:ferredoxin